MTKRYKARQKMVRLSNETALPSSSSPEERGATSCREN